MAAVGLLFVGAVLYLNAVMLLGRADPASVGVFNLFVGALQTAVPFYLVATATTSDDVLFASGIFLFGFTYLYVGITNLAGHSTRGLGWYCSWVSVLALGYAGVSFFKLDDPKFGVIWLFWAFLWALFFIVLGLERTRFARYTAWVTLIEAWLTAAIPGFLLLGGWWDNVPTAVVLAAGAAAAVSFILLGLRTIAAPRAVVAAGNDRV